MGGSRKDPPSTTTAAYPSTVGHFTSSRDPRVYGKGALVAPKATAGSRRAARNAGGAASAADAARRTGCGEDEAGVGSRRNTIAGAHGQPGPPAGR